MERDFGLQSLFEQRAQPLLTGFGQRRSSAIDFRADPGDMLGKWTAGVQAYPVPNVAP